MRHSTYLINGEDVHISRFLVSDGEPLFDPYDFALTNFRGNLAGFGPSVLATLWDDIVKAIGTRQAAYQLIQTNNAILMAVDGLQDLQGTKSGQAALQKLRQIAQQLSVYNAALVDGNKVDIKQHSASFGSVPELVLTFIQILSAGSDIPATRFLGQAPGGLNATGESDLENYYNVIDAYQRQRIEPQLRRACDVVGYWKFPKQWEKWRELLTFKFPPLWNASELEEAQKNAQNIDNVMKLFDAGLVDEAKVIQEINAKGALSVTLDESDISLVDAAEAGPGPAQGGIDQDTPKFAAETPPVKQETQRLRNVVAVRNADSTSLLIKAAGGSPDSIDHDQFRKGFEVEHEHADTVGGDKVTIAKIVLDHLAEDADYYTKLERVENAISLDQLPEPTEAQIHSGNYKKHHLKLHGLDISIENPQGSIRRGTGPDGTPWESVLPAHYGYVKRTEGADGDHVAVSPGPHEARESLFGIVQASVDEGELDE